MRRNCIKLASTLGRPEAKRALERLMAAAPVTCEERGNDRYGRTVGLCRVGGRDIGADMVQPAWRGRSLGTVRTTSPRRNRRLVRTP